MKKTVLITGASRGIGKAAAIEFAKKGYNVAVNYVENDIAAENLKSYLVETLSANVILVKADVSDENQVKDMVKKVIEHFGNIDVLVNNAGIAIDTTFEDKTVENFRRTLDVNTIGPFLISREVGKHMLEQKKGSIINITSTNGMETYYEYSLDYDASKAALISLTHNLCEIFAPYIRVNAIAPGWVNTEMNKELDEEYIKEECKNIYQNRFAEPEEIARVIVFLAGDDASYINNEVIRVDGGNRHA